MTDQVQQSGTSLSRYYDHVTTDEDFVKTIKPKTQNMDLSENDPVLKENKRHGKGLTCNLVLAIFACVIGTSFQFGYNTGVVNAPQGEIEQFLNETNFHREDKYISKGRETLLWSTIVAIWAVGGMMGGISCAFFTDMVGRKGTMLLNNVVIIIGTLLMVLSKKSNSYEMLIAGRFVTGLACGISTGVAPVYLSEIAPVHLRGAAGTINQFAVVVAILISEVLGLEQILGTETLWPYLLGVPFIPAAIQLAILPFCPESPRFLLLKKKQPEKAERALSWLRNTHEIGKEMQEIQSEEQSTADTKKVTMCDLFNVRALRTPLIISIILHLSQQLSGINAVIYYSTSIFESAGLSHSSAQYATLSTGAVNVAMTFVSAVLVDFAGRRTLHLTGLGGMFIFAILLSVSLICQRFWSGFSYFSIIAALGYIVAFATGPGSIPWFIVAELFAQGPRSAAISVAVLVNWTANFLVGVGFPAMHESLKDYSFIPFVVLLAIFWLFTYFKVPETKGKTIEEITSQFRSEQDDHVQYQRIEPDESYFSN